MSTARRHEWAPRRRRLARVVFEARLAACTSPSEVLSLARREAFSASMLADCGNRLFELLRRNGASAERAIRAMQLLGFRSRGCSIWRPGWSPRGSCRRPAALSQVNLVCPSPRWTWWWLFREPALVATLHCDANTLLASGRCVLPKFL